MRRFRGTFRFDSFANQASQHVASISSYPNSSENVASNLCMRVGRWGRVLISQRRGDVPISRCSVSLLVVCDSGLPVLSVDLLMSEFVGSCFFGCLKCWFEGRPKRELPGNMVHGCKWETYMRTCAQELSGTAAIFAQAL